MLVLAAYLVYTEEKPVPEKKPKALKAFPIFLLGAGITLLNIPTMLPYLAAINVIVKEKLSFVATIGMLLFYNLVYILPLLILLIISIVAGKQATPLLMKINAFIDKWSAKVTALFSTKLELF